MGTNFYRVPILTKARKEKLYKLIDEEKWTSGFMDEEDSVMSMITELSEGVHICKRSAGWYINFDHNWGKYYQPNRKSLEKFLSEPGYIIKDEYGEKYTPEEFWEMVDEWNNSKKGTADELWTSATYRQWEQKEHPEWFSSYYKCNDDINKVYSTFGIRTNDDDFIVDGLRFSVFTDFS